MDSSRSLEHVAALLADLLKQRCRAFNLTDRETEIADLVLRGYSNKQIADVCCISGLTVRDHLRHAFQKMGIHQRTEILPWLVGAGPAAPSDDAHPTSVALTPADNPELENTPEPRG